MTEPRPPAAPGDGDAERDAWLREALRHAPDAALSPPALLRDSILLQARAAVAPPLRSASTTSTARPANRDSAFAAFWSWLARPPVAAGFASVMAATLVGLMWWDRPMDEAMSRPPSEVAAPSAPAETAAATPASPTAAATQEQAPATTPAAAPLANAQAPAAPPGIVAQPPSQQAAELRAKAAAPAGVSRSDNAVPFPAEAKEERSGGVAQDALKKDDKSMAAPAPASPAPALADNSVGSREKDRSAAPERARQGTAAAAGGRLDAARDGEPATAFAQASPRSEPPSSLRRSESATPAKLGRSAASDRPLVPLLSTLAADASRVTRIGGDGRSGPVDEAALRWLAALDAATAGRWLAVDAAGDRGPADLDLRIDGQAAITIAIEPTAATLASRAGGVLRLHRAELGAEAAERLRTSLPRMPP